MQKTINLQDAFLNPARLLEIRETEAGQLLLFRLNEGGECLKIRWIEAEIERGG